jgi:hypothetical protein
MKTLNKIWLGIICFIFITTNNVFAQNNFMIEKNHIFEHLDISKISKNILSDYGVNLVLPDGFNGVPTDSNFVDINTFRKLYCGLYSSRVNTANNNMLLPQVKKSALTEKLKLTCQNRHNGTNSK